MSYNKARFAIIVSSGIGNICYSAYLTRFLVGVLISKVSAEFLLVSADATVVACDGVSETTFMRCVVYFSAVVAPMCVADRSSVVRPSLCGTRRSPVDAVGRPLRRSRRDDLHCLSAAVWSPLGRRFRRLRQRCDVRCDDDDDQDDLRVVVGRLICRRRCGEDIDVRRAARWSLSGADEWPDGRI